ncbi:MAG: SusC/RagA family TonB-linked outer membrane protein, partial [Reichenbachiella sp.]|uniref:SusC/RagA family TonB-linked outer membrane protein n=1 Tax=Reichenbachiella sp. TaxID=2184521 RepID=UPI003298FA0E
EQLQEVVVIGYGTANKSDLTGSISSISSKDFSAQPIIRAEDALQSRAAGVQVLKNSGAPGGDIKIRIRGANSINGNNSPLVVIDGIARGDLSSLNSNDIENINILKDASASAIYGSRGANGVVLVTTKKGSSKPEINVGYFASVTSLPNKIDLMSSEEFADLVGSTVNNGGADYQDEYFQNGLTNNLQLSLSGKEGKLSYFISGNYVDQEGIVTNTDYMRTSLRSNLNAELTNKLTVGLNIFGSRENMHNLVNGGTRGSSDVRGGVTNVLSFDPSLSVRDVDGNYNLTSDNGSILVNPIAVQNESDANLIEDRFNANLNVSYDLLDGLNFTVLGGASFLHSNKEAFYGIPAGSSVLPARASFNSKRGTDLQLSNILSWKKEFGNTNMTLTGIYELQSFDTKTAKIGSEQYALSGLSDAYYLLELGTVNAEADLDKSTLKSYVARAEVSVAEQLLVTGTIRVDESSKFRPGNRVGYFPSISAGYNLGQFLPDGIFVENIKLRAGYGETGNQNIPAFSTAPYLPNDPKYAYFFNGESTVVGLASSPIVDEDLTWETTKQFNVGSDFSFLDGRIQLSIDWYKKNTVDLLLDQPVPKYAGGGIVRTNIGEVQNTGIDLSLNATVINNSNFSWNSTFVLSKVNNEVLDLGGVESIQGKALNSDKSEIKPGGSDDNYYSIDVGQSLGNFYGATYLGADNATGVAVYDTLDNGANRLGVIGNGMPELTWGFNNTMKYRKFDLNFLLRGVHGYDVFNATRAVTFGGSDSAPTNAEYLNRWTADNNSNIPSSGSNVIASSRYIEDASFIRLSNVSIGYTMPSSKWFNSIRVYISAQNLLTITDYKGYDPEVSSTGANDQDGTPSMDFGALPNPRSYTFGFNLSF